MCVHHRIESNAKVKSRGFAAFFFILPFYGIDNEYKQEHMMMIHRMWFAYYMMTLLWLYHHHSHSHSQVSVFVQ